MIWPSIRYIDFRLPLALVPCQHAYHPVLLYLPQLLSPLTSALAAISFEPHLRAFLRPEARVPASETLPKSRNNISMLSDSAKHRQQFGDDYLSVYNLMGTCYKSHGLL